MKTLMIMAGGTGGHVFPALAVAADLRERGVHVVWLGTREGLEARAVPGAGFDIEWITIRGLRGKGLWGLARTPFLVIRAMLQTARAVRRQRPGALLGMGGFVAGPGGLVAWLMRRPLLIHEANALAGLTNRLLARLADRVMTGFPNTFAKPFDEEWVGNPVRPDIAAITAPGSRLAGRSGPLRLLIVGGSQGARALNEFVPAALGELPDGTVVSVRHQAGRGAGAGVRSAYAAHGADAEVFEFIDDMAAAYTWADLVICRAGAMTVAEICAAGAAALFVPFPYAAGDHQTANAKFLCDRGAAMMLPEHDLTAAKFHALLQELSGDRSRLLTLAEGARAQARPDATRRVADACVEVLSA